MGCRHEFGPLPGDGDSNLYRVDIATSIPDTLKRLRPDSCHGAQDLSLAVNMASLTRQRKPIHMRTGSPPPSSSKIKPPTHNTSSRPILSSYDDLPSWHQDNDFIIRGYRPVSNSVFRSFESWLYLHNETINIFSHLIPAVFFLAAEGLIYQYFEVHYPKSTNWDRLAFAFFLLTVATCFFFSVTYHTLMNHSDYISHLLLRIDFVGIVIHTIGNFVSGIYVVFYCEPTLQNTYWTMVCPFPTLQLQGS